MAQSTFKFACATDSVWSKLDMSNLDSSVPQARGVQLCQARPDYWFLTLDVKKKKKKKSETFNNYNDNWGITEAKWSNNNINDWKAHGERSIRVTLTRPSHQCVTTHEDLHNCHNSQPQHEPRQWRDKEWSGSYYMLRTILHGVPTRLARSYGRKPSSGKRQE